jgi:hypothetical protein
MDANALIGLAAIVGILWLCSKIANAGKGQGVERTPQELDARYSKGRNQRTED